MQAVNTEILQEKQHNIYSSFLNRQVIVDFYMPQIITSLLAPSLLLINDGQNLKEIYFANMLHQVSLSQQIQPVLCVGIHACDDRMNEYGTAHCYDFAGRGTSAKSYQQFIVNELLPYIHNTCCIAAFDKIGVAGFSLGGLSALDIVWSHPELFTIAGVFSGSLWWRSKNLDAGYREDVDRIMHQRIRNGKFHPGLYFYFTTGSLDETADRNHNGIIDSIDDTLALIEELEQKGYTGNHIKYINYADGRHDTATWGRALPQFLKWSFGNIQ